VPGHPGRPAAGDGRVAAAVEDRADFDAMRRQPGRDSGTHVANADEPDA